MFARILLTLLWSLLLYRTMPAQGLKPEAVTIENGLSQGMIFDICQTRDGFLWVATKDGLNRYDGYNFNIFSNDPFDPYSLAENTVTALFEDSRGWLWVGTESKGLDLYDRRSGRFHHFSLNFKRNIKAISFEIHAICEAPDGTIYLLQKGNGLIRVAIPAGWKDRLPAEPDLGLLTKTTLFPIEQFKASGNKNEELLVALQPQKNGDLWVWSNQMPYIVEPDKDIARPLATAQWQEAGSGIRHDTWGAIPYSLVRFRNGQATLPEFPPGLKINWSMVKPAANGDTWVAVNRQLWRLSPGEDLDFSNPDWVTDENISTAATDRNGNIWIGTHGYGLRKFNPKKQLFHTGAAGTSMWGLWRNTRGRYFCKVVNEVFPYDPATGKIGTERAFPDGPKRLLDACIESSGSFWLLGRGEAENGQAELAHYDPESRLIRRYSFTFNPYVYARILQNREGYLWMTGLNCQLVRFDPKTARFDYFDYASLFGENANTVRAFALEEDGNGVLWIGTQQGLVKGMPNGRSFDFQLIQADSDNPEGLNNNSIACLLADPAEPAGVLWIGTKGGGINRLDLRSGLFQHIKTKDGLPDNVIYGILPGNKDELWCSTNRGLAKLRSRKTTPASFDITTFTAAQGLQDNEFNTQAFFKAANGELLFGGVNGLNRFFPDEVRSDTTPPPVFIVGLDINHHTATFGSAENALPGPLEYQRELQLSYDQNNLSFEFTALDFTDPSKNRYRYRLVGLDQDWVETGTNRFAHFTHLAPGRYNLLVQGSNGEGVWQNAANQIAILILPPWWRSNMAYLLYALLLLWAGWQAYRFQIRRVQLREQLAFEHRETGRVKALEQMKTNFFSNITHEFRTPLTLILEPARRILAQTKEPETAENARHIASNSHRLLSLVNQLLDMAKLENDPGYPGGIDLRHGNFAETVRAVHRSFLPLAEQRGIRLGLRIADNVPAFLYDVNKTETVLNNLISNALKFTPKGGQVDVRVMIDDLRLPGERTETDNRKSKIINIQVTDTGIGIPAEALDKIFDRFYQVDGSHTRAGEGTGIGLALSKELAELMGGSISVESEPGKGATFTFWLPVVTGVDEPGAATTEPASPAVPETTSSAETGRPIVLLIEDNAELRGFVKQCIAGQWQVVEASNGEEGVQKAVELVPDLVISDVMMPHKDGYTVCDELKNNELTAHIPVILLTAKSAMDSKIKGLRTGADDYLTKPFNTEELLARMENLVELRRQLRKRYGLLPATAPAASAPGETVLLSTPDQEFLRRFTRTVEQHLPDETIGVEDLAQKMFISRVQLHRKLKAITDRNVTDFVRDYRLERAMAMLKNREGRVYEVASKVGFGNEKYFSRAFKEKFGIPPSQVM